MNTFNNILIKNILYAIKLSLNEMARKAVTRTIDNKLWLSVASTCSRNRSNEAEYIKPMGNDKNILLQKYVAALIIMKKPCPQSIEDMVDIKTFKLVGKKLIELGVSLDEILQLYDLNTGKTSVAKKQLDTLQPENNTSNQPEQDTPVRRSGGLFDDDIFNDDDELDSFAQDLIGLDPATSLEIVWSKLTNTPKPRGWKFIKHVGDTYDKFTITGKLHHYYNKKYISDVKKIITRKEWKLYTINNSLGLNWILSSVIYWEDFDEKLSDNLIEQKLKELCIDHGYKHINDNEIHDYMIQYKNFKEYRKKTINAMDDTYVLNLFKNNNAIYDIYLSPDRGIQITISRLNDYPENSVDFLWEMTFTGLVNYNKQEGFDYDLKKELNKIKDLKARISNLNKIRKFFNKFIKDRCLWRMSDYYYECKFDENNNPYYFRGETQGSMENTINWWSTQTLNKYSYKKCFKDIHSSEPNVIKELLMNDDVYEQNRCYLRLIFIKDLHHKYTKDDYTFLIKLTDEGYKKFNRYYNIDKYTF